jgi:subtilisin family serine protease
MRRALAVIAVVFAVVLSFAFISISADSRQMQQQMPMVQEDVAPDEFFISFRDGLTEANKSSVGRLGMQIRSEFPEIGAISVKTNNPRLLWAMKENPRVEYIEPVPMRYPLGLAEEQLIPAINNGLYGLLTTHSMEAHSRGIMGGGINVGVADTGIDYTHPDIAPNYKGGIDTVGEGDNDPSWNNDPGETHGTHTAGTIVAANNNLGVVGVAPSVNLYHARVLGPRGGRSSDVMRGVRHLVEVFGCKVINMSLGGGASSKTEGKFYKEMRKKGVLVVASSGNDGEDQVGYPAGYAVNIAVGAVDRNNALAGFSNTGKNLDVVGPGVSVISSVPIGTGVEVFVSTSTADTFAALPLEFAGQTSGINRPQVFCGIGRVGEFPASVAGNIALIERGTLTFAEKVANAMSAGAVGVIIYNNTPGGFSGTLGSPKTPDGRNWVPALSVSNTTGATLKNQSGAESTIVNHISNWDQYSGTSMSAPHVTGVIALIWSANPNLTNTEVEKLLFDNCTDLGTPSYDTTYGHGLVNASKALAAMGK